MVFHFVADAKGCVGGQQFLFWFPLYLALSLITEINRVKRCFVQKQIHTPSARGARDVLDRDFHCAAGTG